MDSAVRCAEGKRGRYSSDERRRSSEFTARWMLRGFCDESQGYRSPIPPNIGVASELSLRDSAWRNTRLAPQTTPDILWTYQQPEGNAWQLE